MTHIVVASVAGWVRVRVEWVEGPDAEYWCTEGEYAVRVRNGDWRAPA